MIWYMIWYDMIWYDMIWYDMIRYDMMWYDMIWYDMTWYDMIWYDMIWYDMIWYDMIWYDMIWYDMIWYDMIWYDVSDSCMLVWPIQSPISMCTQTLCNQFDLLFFLLQVSCHYGAIPLDSVASSHPHLLACHFSYRILLQPLTNTLTKGPLANREHVLVCVWNVHQLLHIQRGAQLEQFWQSSHEDAHWWVNSWKNTLVKTVLSSQVHR